MYMCVHVYVCVYIYICIYIYIYTHKTHTHLSPSLSLYIYIYVYTHLYLLLCSLRRPARPRVPNGDATMRTSCLSASSGRVQEQLSTGDVKTWLEQTWF